MTDPKHLTDDELDDLFAAARDQAPQPSADLMARIAADAGDIYVRPAVAGPRRGPLARIVSALGGWPSVTGLAAASAAGVFIGFAAPEAVDLASGGYVTSAGYDVAELLPDYSDLLGGG